MIQYGILTFAINSKKDELDIILGHNSDQLKIELSFYFSELKNIIDTYMQSDIEGIDSSPALKKLWYRYRELVEEYKEDYESPILYGKYDQFYTLTETDYYFNRKSLLETINDGENKIHFIDNLLTNYNLIRSIVINKLLWKGWKIQQYSINSSPLDPDIQNIEYLLLKTDVN